MAPQKVDLPVEKIVLPLELRFNGTEVHVSKPDSPGPYDSRYTVENDCVCIKKGPYPVYLVIPGAWIVCMGFAKGWRKPKKHCKPGRCGECFSFEPAPDLNSIVIQNDGGGHPHGYTWYLWDDIRGERLPFDPRIYNEGGTLDLDEPPERRGCLGALGRLMARLRL